MVLAFPLPTVSTTGGFQLPWRSLTPCSRDARHLRLDHFRSFAASKLGATSVQGTLVDTRSAERLETSSDMEPSSPSRWSVSLPRVPKPLDH